MYNKGLGKGNNGYTTRDWETRGLGIQLGFGSWPLYEIWTWWRNVNMRGWRYLRSQHGLVDVLELVISRALELEDIHLCTECRIRKSMKRCWKTRMITPSSRSCSSYKPLLRQRTIPFK